MLIRDGDVSLFVFSSLIHKISAEIVSYVFSLDIEEREHEHNDVLATLFILGSLCRGGYFFHLSNHCTCLI
jgi:signal-transduction protein with cAMP-binding, CBS, and nucleotidyltransferase domain